MTLPRWLVAGVAAHLCVALAVGATGCAPAQVPGRQRMRAAPLAAVLVSGRRSTLQVVDLDRGQAVASYYLGTAAFDVTADERSGSFLTAQAGGVGSQSDDRLGVIDVRDAARLRYVRLPWPNPAFVAALEGRAYVAHGVVADGALRLSVVDIRQRSVAATGYVPDGTADVSVQAGEVLIPHFVQVGRPDSTGDRRVQPVLGRLDPATLESTAVVDGVLAGGGLVAGDPVGPGDTVLLAGARDHQGSERAASAEVWRVDVRRGRVLERVGVPGLREGIGAIAACGESVALLDAEPLGGSAAGAIVILDAVGLKQQRRIPVSAGPVAIAGWRETLLIAEAGKGVLRAIDPSSGKHLWSVPLEGSPVALSIAVLDVPGE